MSAWLPQVDSSVVLDGLTSLLLLLFLLIVRALIVRAISKNPTLSMEAKRRWVVSVRNSAIAWCLCCWWGWSSFGRTNFKPCRVSRGARRGARVGDQRTPSLLERGGATDGRESLLGG